MAATANPTSDNTVRQTREAVVDQFLAEAISLAKAARDFSFDLYRPEGVPLGVAAVLRSLLEHGPQTVPRIGRGRLTSRQNTQVLVNRMLHAGWVELVVNPSHKRSSLVQLTDSGVQLARAVTNREAELSRLVSPEIPVADLEQATALLARVRGLILSNQVESNSVTLANTKPRAKKDSTVVTDAPTREAVRTPSFPSILEETELPVSLL
jgi:DNA-binding MarR family transcriptional regulator